MIFDNKRLEKEFINSCLENIPSEDFVDAKFDANYNTPITDVVIICSTPRSGSTFLSQVLYESSLCLPHEYFQPYQYLPILADRWGAIENGEINKQHYVNSLIENRAGKDGWLGINLHGEHLSTFSEYLEFFPAVNWHFIHLQRQNTIHQAVSYEIASQNQKWSKFYEGDKELTYNYEQIVAKLERINRQNSLTVAFLNDFSPNYHNITYENYISSPTTHLENILGISLNYEQVGSKHQLKKQGGDINDKWIKRFSKEYFANNKNKTHISPISAGNKSGFINKLTRRLNIGNSSP